RQPQDSGPAPVFSAEPPQRKGRENEPCCKRNRWFGGGAQVIRLLICDDSAHARTALRAMLLERDEIEIVGEAHDGEEAVELAAALSPDVVLMDVAMPILDGVGATYRIRQLLPA